MKVGLNWLEQGLVIVAGLAQPGNFHIISPLELGGTAGTKEGDKQRQGPNVGRTYFKAGPGGNWAQTKQKGHMKGQDNLETGKHISECSWALGSSSTSDFASAS